MAQLIKVQFRKTDAVFANAELARNDKNSLFSQELQDACGQSNANALAAEILLDPPYFEWDQETFTLSICKVVTSNSEYNQSITFDNQETDAAANAAGWTRLDSVIIDI